MEVHRAESLNGSPVFIRALADIVAQHLKEIGDGALPTSVQIGLRCPGCSNTTCCPTTVGNPARVTETSPAKNDFC